MSAAAFINFFLQKCGAYLRAALKTIVIPISTVFTRILINSPPPLKSGAYLRATLIRVRDYCNWQLKSLLHLGQVVLTFRIHLGQNVITFRTLLHLGPFITFRPFTSTLSE